MAFDVRKPPVSFQIYGFAGQNHSPGLVPDPGSVSGLGQVLTDEGWSVIAGPGTFGFAGPSHSSGLVPDPGIVAGLDRILTDEGWSVAPGPFGFAGSSHSVGLVPDPGSVSGLGQILTDHGWSIVGNVGQYVFSQVGAGSAVAFIDATTADVTSIVLTAGDWDVWAQLSIGAPGSSTQIVARAWINTASAIDPGAPNGGAYADFPFQFAISGADAFAFPVGAIRINITSGSQTVYLSANLTFSVSSLNVYGFLGARIASLM
jgi:hypothetical protein